VSVCSDKFITKQEAMEMVKHILMYNQQILVEQAVKGMDKHELIDVLNKECEFIYYNIVKGKNNESKDS